MSDVCVCHQEAVAEGATNVGKTATWHGIVPPVVVVVDAQGGVSIIKCNGNCNFITDLKKLHYTANRFISC